MNPPRHRSSPREPRTAPAAGPAREGPIARALRWAQDRRSLVELDDRLLRDVGLTRGDVTLGTPLASPPGRGRTGLRAAPPPGAFRAGRRA
ncbi:DUF1127 domain-containing protein [Craurococcus roseus]|uniref:DUF1127 domain-containing protein n=1 Tax=Craurococcus roseus TaxID=77585 RepID=UPI0038D1C0F1